jgi:glycosyltransferase involved in cell wall biosynthesis
MNIGKIGVGICTFNRENYFKQVYKALQSCVIDELVMVNDGKPYDFKPTRGRLIQQPQNGGIAKSKNTALNYLQQNDCDHIFIMEDDIIVKNPHVFKEYISVAMATGLPHLNFEQACPNQHQFDVNYGDGVSISLWRSPQGAFSYFKADVIKNEGNFDENFINAFEHIDVVLRLVQKRLLPPFWFNPDLVNSTDFLESIPGCNENSSITNKPNYQKNWNHSAQYFIQKFGFYTNQIRESSQKDVTASLKVIHENYSKNEIVANNQ